MTSVSSLGLTFCVHACCRAGDPKGVLLKHSAVVATVSSLISFLKEVADEAIGVGDSLLSYLPLAHIFDRCGAAE
jgi:long-chain acyl-CoA synthetase